MRLTLITHFIMHMSRSYTVRPLDWRAVNYSARYEKLNHVQNIICTVIAMKRVSRVYREACFFFLLTTFLFQTVASLLSVFIIGTNIF